MAVILEGYVGADAGSSPTFACYLAHPGARNPVPGSWGVRFRSCLMARKTARFKCILQAAMVHGDIVDIYSPQRIA
jgi:hypothetical protein